MFLFARDRMVLEDAQAHPMQLLLVSQPGYYETLPARHRRNPLLRPLPPLNITS
jgi:hypothetical protein